MNRIRFLKSIIREDRSMVNDVIDFFDQEMLLYELLGGTKSRCRHNVYISDYGSNFISFEILSSKRETDRLSSYLSTLDSTTVVEYEKPLELHYNVTSDRTLNIDIRSTTE